MATATKPIVLDETGKEIVSKLEDIKDAISFNKIDNDTIKRNTNNELYVETATNINKGLVKPDNTSITIEADGTIHSTATGPSDIISDEWKNDITYKVDEYCIDDNKLWKCLQDNINIKPSEGIYWTECKIVDEITSLNDKLGKTTVEIGSLETGITDSGCWVTELNGMGYINLYFSLAKSLSKGGVVSIGKINKTLQKNVHMPCSIFQTSGGMTVGHIDIDTSGNISLTPYAAVTYTVGATYSILIISNGVCKF